MELRGWENFTTKLWLIIAPWVHILKFTCFAECIIIAFGSTTKPFFLWPQAAKNLSKSRPQTEWRVKAFPCCSHILLPTTSCFILWHKLVSSLSWEVGLVNNENFGRKRRFHTRWSRQLHLPTTRAGRKECDDYSENFPEENKRSVLWDVV